MPVGSPVFQSQHAIIGQYLTSNWRAFRTWGVSAISPWELAMQEHVARPLAGLAVCFIGNTDTRCGDAMLMAGALAGIDLCALHSGLAKPKGAPGYGDPRALEAYKRGRVARSSPRSQAGASAR